MTASQVVKQENNLGVGRSEPREPNASKVRELNASKVVGSEGAVSRPSETVFGHRAPLRKLFGFLRPIDWLKIYPNLVGFFFLFFVYYL